MHARAPADAQTRQGRINIKRAHTRIRASVSYRIVLVPSSTRAEGHFKTIISIKCRTARTINPNDTTMSLGHSRKFPQECYICYPES